jgi:excisionase family DNA binding protein
MTTPSGRDGDSDRMARDPLLTVAQAGEYLGTGERFVRRLITERRIPYVKLGKYVRLQRSVLDAFVDAGRVHSLR